MRTPLKYFWEHDKDAFRAAVAKLPLEYANLHLVLLVSPMLQNAASMDIALKGSRNMLVKYLRQTLAADEELYILALAAMPEDKRARLDTQVRTESQQAQRGRTVLKRRSGVSNKEEWQQALKHRKRALDRVGLVRATLLGESPDAGGEVVERCTQELPRVCSRGCVVGRQCGIEVDEQRRL